MLDAPDAIGGVRWPGRELLGQRADVRPFARAGGGGCAFGGLAELREVERGEERSWEDDEAVAVEKLSGGFVGVRRRRWSRCAICCCTVGCEVWREDWKLDGGGHVDAV